MTVSQKMFVDAGVPSTAADAKPQGKEDDEASAGNSGGADDLTDDMVVGAGAWLLFSLDDLRKGDPDPRLYGSKDWRGLALQIVAAAHASDPARACQIDSNAIERDPQNQAALFGLLNMGLRAEPPSETALAGTEGVASKLTEDLKALYDDLGWTPKTPLAARVGYAHLAASVHEALLALQSDPPSVPEARAELTKAKSAGEALVACLDAAVLGKDLHEGDAAVYASIKDLSKAALWGLERLLEPPGTMPTDLGLALLDRPRYAYNVACCWATPALHCSDVGRLSSDDIESALLLLRYATQIDSLATWAQTDPSLHWLRAASALDFAAAIGQPALEDVEGLDDHQRKGLAELGVKDLSSLRAMYATTASAVTPFLTEALKRTMELAVAARVADEHLPVLAQASVTAAIVRSRPAGSDTPLPGDGRRRVRDGRAVEVRDQGLAGDAPAPTAAGPDSGAVDRQPGSVNDPSPGSSRRPKAPR